MPYYLNQEGIGSDLAPLQAFTPTGKESLAAQVSETWAGSPLPLGIDALGIMDANRHGPRLTAVDAQRVAKEAGVPEFSPGEAEYSREALDIALERKRAERKRQDVIASTPWSWTGTPLRGAAMLATTLLDPLNVGSAFVPVVGEARYAALLAKAGGSAARWGIRAGVGAAEGAVGTLALEPFIYGAHAYLDDDYTMRDSIANFAFGTFLGGGLHAVGGGFADALHPGRWDVVKTLDDAAAQPDLPAPRTTTPTPEPGSAADTALRAGPEARAAATTVGMGQFAEGRLIEVEPVVGTVTADTRALGHTVELRGTSGQRQLDLTMTLHDGARAVGRVDYSVVDGVPSISMIEVAEADRRKGYGTALMQRLQQEYPDAQINLGMMTDDGAALNKSLKFREVVNEPIAKANAELKAARAEADALQRKSDAFDALDAPTKQQVDEHHAWMRDVGEHWNELHDRIYKLEEQVRGKAEVRRFVEPPKAPAPVPMTPEAIRAAAARSSSPEGLATVEHEAAEAAAERLKQAPKRTDVVAATKMADDAEARAMLARSNLEAAGATAKQLKAFDEAMAEANGFVAHGDELGRAVEFAAECGIGRA